MPRSASYTIAAAAALALVCAAGRSPGSDAVPAAAAGVSGEPKAPRLLVLRSGRVIDGAVRLAQGGYEVERGGGRVFFAESHIWFTAESRAAAYKTLKERIPYGTADTHVRIAQWCVENGLYSSARDELRLALRLEPKHPDARSMLRLLEGDGGDARGPASSRDPFSEEVPTLGGLPTDPAQEFVGKVQPLLVNRCGNVACHGGTSGGGFSLKVVRPGNPAYRALTLQNLEAVRGQLSAERPEASPLLVEPSRLGHGGSRKPLFAGPAGEAQRRMLAAWVRRVAKSIPEPATPDEGAAEPDRLLLTSGAAAEPKTDAPAETVGPPPEPSSADADPTADLLQRALAEEQPDAFDPDEFNRRFGPRAGETSPSPSDGPTR